MDVWACTTMKDAASCDKQCELQNSVTQQDSERECDSWDFPKNASVSDSTKFIDIIVNICHCS
jgi:hypothetical protein